MKKLEKFLDILRYPKLYGDYYIYLKRWYKSPSLRQAKILKKNLTIESIDPHFDLIKNQFDKKHLSVVLDIGANIGYKSIFYANKLKSSGLVFGFEVLSKNLSYLTYNTSDLKNFYLFPFGLSNKCDKIIFDIPEYVPNYKKNNTGLISSIGLGKETKFREERMVVKLDSFLNGFIEKNDILEFMKIDVEGAEQQVLEGSIKTILKLLPIIQLEYNPRVTEFIEFKKIIKIILHSKSYKIFSNIEFTDEKSQVEFFFIPKPKLKKLEKIKLFNELFFKVNYP